MSRRRGFMTNRAIEAAARRAEENREAMSEQNDYAKRLAEIDARVAEQENEETCSTDTVSSWAHHDRGWLLAQLRAASGALTAAGIGEEMNSLAERIKDLGRVAGYECDVAGMALKDLRAASDALVALGVPDDGRPLAERIEALGEQNEKLLGEVQRARRWRITEGAAPVSALFGDTHRWITLIFREGGQLPTTAGFFEEREDAERHYEQAGAQWSDSYLCEVVRSGPYRREEATGGDALAQMREALTGLGHDPELVFERLKDPAFREAFNSSLTALEARREALGDQIDGHELADPPTAPPEALVREYREVGEQIEAAHRAMLGRPRINVLPVEPLSTGTAMAFVDGPGRHGVEEVPTASYPESPQGQAVREFRQEHDISIGQLARALRVSAADVSGLERGSKTTDKAGWTEIQTSLFLLGSAPKENRDEAAGHVADPGSSPAFARAVAAEDEDNEVAGYWCRKHGAPRHYCGCLEESLPESGRSDPDFDVPEQPEGFPSPGAGFCRGLGRRATMTLEAAQSRTAEIGAIARAGGTVVVTDGGEPAVIVGGSAEDEPQAGSLGLSLDEAMERYATPEMRALVTTCRRLLSLRVDLRDEAACAEITPERANAYLRGKGWTSTPPKGILSVRRWRVWTIGDGHEMRTALVPRVQGNDYGRLLLQVIRECADVEKRSPLAVWAEMREAR